MTTQIVCLYTIADSGPLTPATLGAALAAVPLPVDLLSRLGLRLISDSTSGLARTVTLGTDASTPATVTVTYQAGGRTGIASATPGGASQGYVRPPVLTLVPGVGSVVTHPAILVPELEAVAATIVNGGMNYSVGTKVISTGGELAPGGVEATWAPTINGGGTITALAVETAGGPYNVPPTLTAVDPLGLGSGAILTSILGLAAVAVPQSGIGYEGSTTVTVTSYFKSLFKTAAAQAAAVTNFFTGSIQAGVRSPVVASAPVVT